MTRRHEWQPVEAVFYVTGAERVPARDFIDGLSAELAALEACKKQDQAAAIARAVARMRELGV